MDENDYKLPLGLCKQASMKLDAFITDLHEIVEDEDVDPGDRDLFNDMIEVANSIMANLINVVRKECDEEDFLSENVPMDAIGPEFEEDVPEEDLASEDAE